VKTPDRTTAAAFPRYLRGEILADSESLGWLGLYVRRWRFSRVVDRLLMPATVEPHIRCDVTRTEDVKTALDKTIEAFGRLDFAFNNAGIEPRKPAPTADYDEAEWNRIMTSTCAASSCA
jgi:NAD(P)-dependent dehydrogenase (short-subunit alcohol dehydrogenase family)